MKEALEASSPPSLSWVRGRLNKGGALPFALLTTLSLAVVLCALPCADDADASSSGICGEDLTWTLDDEGNLTISGSGPMYDYPDDFASPWSGNAVLKNVMIGQGVTYISEQAFPRCISLASIYVDPGNASYSSSDGALFDKAGASLVKYPAGKRDVGYTIPATVTSIGDSAFYGCSSLVSVDMPSVTSIGERAFYNCASLASVEMPSVKKIGEYAFSQCTSLVSVDLPSAVSIGNGAFYGCSSLVSVDMPSAIYIASIDVFYGCTSLVSVSMPSMRDIGERAFRGCSSLVSVAIPATVTRIGDSAFYGCASLASIDVDPGNAGYSSSDGVLFDKAKKSLIAYPAGKRDVGYTIPATVTSIRDYAFYGCSSLVSVTIPDAVTSIGDSAFYGCSSLVSVAIPATVTSIGSNAFYGCASLASVTIPDAVTSIGDHAFCGCASLASVTIPDAVTSIGNNAFYSCYKLVEVFNCSGLALTKGSTANGYVAYYAENVYTPTSGASILREFVTDDGTRMTFVMKDSQPFLIGVASDGPDLSLPEQVCLGGATFGSYPIHEYAFYGCSSLASVSMPSVTSIGSYAFYGCSSLASVDMPSVTSIGSYAFSGCISLASVAIPATVTSIGNGAFYRCASLASIDVDPGNAGYSSSDGVLFDKAKKSLIAYPAGKRDVGYTIPATVTRIGDYAFYGCASLASVAIPATVTRIGDDAFYGCASLASVTIPDAVTSIGDHAFRGCSSLASVAIPATVTRIGNYAFYGCSSLVSVTIPDAVTSIGDSAFYGCSSLASVSIPGSVTSIGNYTFWECSSLASVDMPSVTSIGRSAFYRCTSLVSVDMPSAISFSPCAFYGCASLASVTIPDAVTSISDHAFYGCTSLVSVDMPSVTSIGSYAFSGCISLASVSMPSVTSIMKYAFRGCGSLTKITIPCSGPISRFSESPIADLTLTQGTGDRFTGPIAIPRTLVTLTVEEGVRSIGSGAFNGCTSLEYVYLADSVEEVGDTAFCGCISLARFHAPGSLSSVGEMAFHEVSFFDVDGATPIEPGSPRFRGYWFGGEGGSLIREVPVEPGQTFSFDGLEYVVMSAEDLEASVVGCAEGLSRIVVPGAVWLNGEALAVTAIAYRAFYGNADLVSADLGSVSKVDVKAFAQCTKLKTVYAGDSLSTISAYAFAKCTRLVNFDMSGSLKTMKVIGSYAFLKDERIGGMAIPSFVTTLASTAFSLPFADESGDALETTAESLAGYEYVNVGGTLVRQPSVELGREFQWNGLTLKVTASLPAEVGISGYSGKPRSLELSAPVELDGVEYAVTSVMKGAFKGCRTLTSASIPGVESVGENAFYACTKLASLSAPDLRSVGTKAFCRCYSLADLDLGDRLRTISAYGFWGCSSLESVDLPDTVRSIGTYAFQGCSSLTSIELGESLRLIGSKAFDGTAIVSLVIPDTIIRLKAGALSGCPELREVSFEGGTKVILHAGVFEGTPNVERIAMPDGFKKIYAGAFDGITFLDSDGNPLAAKARNLAGHVFAGAEGVLAMES